MLKDILARVFLLEGKWWSCKSCDIGIKEKDQKFRMQVNLN